MLRGRINPGKTRDTLALGLLLYKKVVRENLYEKVTLERRPEGKWNQPFDLWEQMQRVAMLLPEEWMGRGVGGMGRGLGALKGLASTLGGSGASGGLAEPCLVPLVVPFP